MIKRLLLTNEGLKVSFSIVGIVLGLIFALFGVYEMLAMVFIMAAIVWGWRPTLVMLGLATFGAIFSRNIVIGLLLFFVFFCIAIITGVFYMIGGIISFFTS